MVSTSDSDSGNPSSIPGRTFFFCRLILLQPAEAQLHPRRFDEFHRWLSFCPVNWKRKPRLKGPAKPPWLDKHAMPLRVS